MLTVRAKEKFETIQGNAALARALGMPWETDSDKMAISRLRRGDIRPRQIYPVAKLVEPDEVKRRDLLIADMCERMKIDRGVLIAVAGEVHDDIPAIRACIAGALLPYPTEDDAVALLLIVHEIAA
jgi:hypothetical protein